MKISCGPLTSALPRFTSVHAAVDVMVATPDAVSATGALDHNDANTVAPFTCQTTPVTNR